MDHIQQLKKIRSDAINRLRGSADFKLAGKLGALINELGEQVDQSIDYGQVDTHSPKPFEAIFDNEKEAVRANRASDGMIDELVAEIEDDAQELSSTVKSPKENGDGKVGPFVKSNSLRSSLSNGASH